MTLILNECIVPLGEPEIIASLKLVWEMLSIVFKNGWVVHLRVDGLPVKFAAV